MSNNEINETVELLMAWMHKEFENYKEIKQTFKKYKQKNPSN